MISRCAGSLAGEPTVGQPHPGQDKGSNHLTGREGKNTREIRRSVAALHVLTAAPRLIVFLQEIERYVRVN